MSKVLFLSEATLKAESILQDNVDMKVVTPTIYDVQNIYILTVLGTALYNDLKTKIAAGTLTDADKTLLDEYITPTMVWYVRYELPVNLTYKYFNKAVGVQNSDNMNPASMDDIDVIMNRAKNKAEWYQERLMKYLLANTDTFPLYLNQGNAGIDTIHAKRTSYTNGWVEGADCCRGQYNFTGIKTGKSSFDRCNDC